MFRRALFVALLAAALSLPESAAAQSFSWCNSITSGSCFSGAFGQLGTLSNSGNFQSLLNTLLQQLQTQWGNQNINWASLLGGYAGGGSTTRPPVSVPEPGSLALVATGLFGLAYVGRRRRDET